MSYFHSRLNHTKRNNYRYIFHTSINFYSSSLNFVKCSNIHRLDMILKTGDLLFQKVSGDLENKEIDNIYLRL